jgi:tetratricopeptide (TPR) repeat protein
METSTMKYMIVSAAFAAMIATDALADAVADGNVGLDALNRGAYSEAIRLFTRAIKSGELTGDDKEFAYLNRGRAYIGIHENAKAISDLEIALTLNPSDADAQSALAEARSGVSERSTVRGGWGMLAGLAGRYFWEQEPGKDPRRLMVRFDWLTPQQLLRCVTREKDDTVDVEEYKLDPSTGVIMAAAAQRYGMMYGTTVTSANGYTIYAYRSGTAYKLTVATVTPSSFEMTEQKFSAGAWQDAERDQFVEATPDDAVNGEFFKKE